MIPNKLRAFLQFQRAVLFQYGWLKSLTSGRPVNAQGEPIPWITYPAIDFLSQFDFSEASVFEWGSGNSTLWWASRCRQIATVESNPNWIPYMRPLLPSGVEMIETPLDQTAEIDALLNHHTVKNDVFVVDNFGPYRRACAEAAADHLNEGGIIILDNSDDCLLACEALRARKFIQIDFTGITPGGGYHQCTSIFFRDKPKFRPLAVQPVKSLAQPNPPWEGC